MNKKPAPDVRSGLFVRFDRCEILPLGVLRSSTGSLQTIFFAFFYSSVSGNQTSTSKSRFQFSVIDDQCTCDTVSYGFSLGVDSASGHFDDHSELIHGVTDSESVVYCLLPGGPIKKFVHRFTID